MSALLALATALTQLPFRLWCQWRHRRSWVVDGPGWGWVCRRDGLWHYFSDDDVHKLTALYSDAGRRAAQDLLGRDDPDLGGVA